VPNYDPSAGAVSQPDATAKKRVFDGLALPPHIPYTERRAASTKPISYAEHSDDDFDFDDPVPLPAKKKTKKVLSVPQKPPAAMNRASGPIVAAGPTPAAPPKKFGWGGRREPGTGPRGQKELKAAANKSAGRRK
jgi:hypothetical protein